MNENLIKNSFWVSGKFTVLEIIKKSKRKILQIVIHEKNKDYLNKVKTDNIPLKLENDKFFNKLFKNDLDIHQGFAALVMPLPKIDLNEKLKKLEKNSILLILDGIRDSRNIGSVIRSAAALGCDAIVIEQKNYNPKSNLMFRAASGMTELIDIIPVINITNCITLLKKNNFWIYGMSADAKTDLKNIQFPNRSAFVFGSETNGMKTLVEKNCDELVKIKINKEVESLNISNAVSITLAIANKY